MGTSIGRRTIRTILLSIYLSLYSCSIPNSNSGKPTHVFLLIGDGMGYSSQVVASRYIYGSDSGLSWESFPFRAWMSTYDASMAGYDSALAGKEPWPLGGPESAQRIQYLLDDATDSAAAATAMACGVKTDPGRIGWKNGGAVENICELLASRAGTSVGIVSTVPFNHATPAAFIAHGPDRKDYTAIGEQIRLSRLPRIIVSGGNPAWCPTYLDPGSSLRFASTHGWNVAQRQSGRDGGLTLGIASALLPPGESLLALFGGADGGMETQVPMNNPGSPLFAVQRENPSLARSMVATARLLARDGDPVFLMGEQGDIDWANHANDLPRMIGAVASLDETARALIAYINEPGDAVTAANSAVIVVADHATGLPRFSSSSGMSAGSLPSRVGQSLPAAWAYPDGSRVDYLTGGHANELVRCAVWPESAAPFFEVYRDSDGIIDNAAIFRAMAEFALR
jgi:alkaline phosphatase